MDLTWRNFWFESKAWVSDELGILRDQAHVHMGLCIFLLIAIVLRKRRYGVILAWLVVAVLTVCTMALLPLYFWDANTLFFEGIIQPSDVAAEISRWAFWNWVRTGTSIAATALMLSALFRENVETS